ncbi:MAG: hypothetical protein AVDCRST_MAG89-386, partial [uncultured Gemmatimonadetes bacterium]
WPARWSPAKISVSMSRRALPRRVRERRKRSHFSSGGRRLRASKSARMGSRYSTRVRWMRCGGAARWRRGSRAAGSSRGGPPRFRRTWCCGWFTFGVSVARSARQQQRLVRRR